MAANPPRFLDASAEAVRRLAREVVRPRRAAPGPGPAAPRRRDGAAAGDEPWASLRCTRVAYHGRPGAFAHLACTAALPGAEALGFETIEATFAAVRTGEADAVVLPCENLIAGRVPDVHLMLPDSGLSIVGEHFERIELHLAAPPGARLEDVRTVSSHPVALRQTRRFIGRHRLMPIEHPNTAMAAARIAERADPSEAVIASREAASLYGLEILCERIEDDPRNMTRFYVLAATPTHAFPQAGRTLTTMLFKVANTPAALHRAIGGFAENGINLTRLEGYLADGHFVATRFLCEFEGHIEMPPVRRALKRLRDNVQGHQVLGVYPISEAGPRPRDDTATNRE